MLFKKGSIGLTIYMDIQKECNRMKPVLSVVFGEGAPFLGLALHAAPSLLHPACVPEPRDTGLDTVSQSIACNMQRFQVKEGVRHILREETVLGRARITLCSYRRQRKQVYLK